jgi:hypothetical protein
MWHRCCPGHCNVTWVWLPGSELRRLVRGPEPWPQRPHPHHGPRPSPGPARTGLPPATAMLHRGGRDHHDAPSSWSAGPSGTRRLAPGGTTGITRPASQTLTAEEPHPCHIAVLVWYGGRRGHGACGSPDVPGTAPEAAAGGGARRGLRRRRWRERGREKDAAGPGLLTPKESHRATSSSFRALPIIHPSVSLAG